MPKPNRTEMWWRKQDAKNAMHEIRQLVKRLGRVPRKWITVATVEYLQTAESHLKEAVEFLEADRSEQHMDL